MPGSGGTTATGGTAGSGGTAGGSGGVASGGRRSTGGSPTAGGSGSGGSAADAASSGGALGRGGGGADAGLRTDGPGSGGRATGGATSRGGTGGGGTGGATAAGGNTGAGGRPKVVAAPGATLVKVDVSTEHQRFEGWGTSLAWWAYQIGGWSSGKKNQFLELIVDPVAGLGYNIFRYNIGGGDDPAHDHMGENREMPGFQSASGTWDWNADVRQTSVLTQLVVTGKDVIIEAFSNSPPYWMTKSGCASGNTDGSNNLKDDAYDDFAAYLVTVTKHYRDVLGIAFRTLEPMNEPNANWWKANGGQEGCHFGASSQQQIIKAVAAELTAQGVTETRVSASDENSMDEAVSIMGGYDSATLAAMVQMNVHSYSGSKRAQMRQLATSKGKRLWQSESGPLSVDLATNTDAALFMAGRIIQDLRELAPEAWIEWQVVDPATSWTSFTVNDAQETWRPLKRFYAQAGFSRYIRPGATFVDIDNADMVAALSGDGSTLTIVVRNGDSTASRSYTFDLTSLAAVGSTVEAHRTSASEDLVRLAAIAVQDWSYTVTAAAYSVTTYVIPLGG
ncbi:MAG: alpha-L-arabinofuranosidase [Deltaproteobacteria bacterium]|nr:alpha-L-arabinofuranosidase [Deltaproteobacteria bacterium]